MGIALAGKHQLGINVSIKHNSVISASKKESMKLNAELAVCLDLKTEQK